MRRQCIAEAIGTFALVFAGCGAIVVNDLYDAPLGHVGVSLVFGLVVMAMIYSVGNVSGAHLNPAVTVGFWAAGRLRARAIVPYSISQLAGALLAAGLLRVLFGAHATLGATLPGDSLVRAFAMEVALTFLLMFVILNVSTGAMEKGIMAGAAVGGTVALAALMGGPVSGASMNPARSLAPAVASLRLGDVWLYLLAPLVGALLASPTCAWLQGDECCYVNPDEPAEASEAHSPENRPARQAESDRR
jgi:aquaporin Z